MKLLMHVCCGPCLIYPLKVLRSEGLSVDGFFYNPNIHPYMEFKKRMECMEDYAKAQGMRVASEVGYDLEDFLRRVVWREDERCASCYEIRLRKTAQAAADSGYKAFTTTLLYSKYQKHELIVQIGNVVARDTGVEFIYRDFREGWGEGQELSRELNMYRQKYCGCVYSEKERYLKPAASSPDLA
ncbi:MAG TPA: epoxyqueuosine reductase QueH [Nitrospirota bacterium]|nr:epoxyqueuosine reductase QueH [Nitrospirota bacterium]